MFVVKKPVKGHVVLHGFVPNLASYKTTPRKIVEGKRDVIRLVGQDAIQIEGYVVVDNRASINAVKIYAVLVVVYMAVGDVHVGAVIEFNTCFVLSKRINHRTIVYNEVPGRVPDADGRSHAICIDLEILQDTSCAPRQAVLAEISREK